MKTGVEINQKRARESERERETREQLSPAHHLLPFFQHMSTHVYIRTLPEQDCVEDSLFPLLPTKSRCNVHVHKLGDVFAAINRRA